MNPSSHSTRVGADVGSSLAKVAIRRGEEPLRLEHAPAEAIDHLLANAIRYTDAGGRVLVHGDGNRQAARIVVSDNGPGMDVKAQALAFDRFKRAEQAKKGESLGFGLPLARQLVEAHSGTLTLMSEPGQGTAITMELPRG